MSEMIRTHNWVRKAHYCHQRGHQHPVGKDDPHTCKLTPRQRRRLRKNDDRGMHP